MTPQSLAEALADAPPASVCDAFALAARLEANEPGEVELMQLQPEMEAAVVAIENYAYKCKEVLAQCSKLKAVAAVTVPVGF